MAVLLVVDLRARGCGGAPDPPPHLLLRTDGSTVGVPVDPLPRPDLDALPPCRCTSA